MRRHYAVLFAFAMLCGQGAIADDASQKTDPQSELIFVCSDMDPVTHAPRECVLRDISFAKKQILKDWVFLQTWASADVMPSDGDQKKLHRALIEFLELRESLIDAGSRIGLQCGPRNCPFFRIEENAIHDGRAYVSIANVFGEPDCLDPHTYLTEDGKRDCDSRMSEVAHQIWDAYHRYREMTDPRPPPWARAVEEGRRPERGALEEEEGDWEFLMRFIREMPKGP